jgi:regulator of sigma E protease
MVDSSAYYMGLRNGDFITSLDGKPVRSITRIPVEIIMNGVSYIEGVHTNGEKFSLPVDNDDRSRMLKRLKKSPFVEARFIAIVDSVDASSFAANSDLRKDDRIIAVNGVPVTYFDELRSELIKNKGKSAELRILRGGDTVVTSSKISEEGTLGFFKRRLHTLDVQEQKFNLGSALTQGINDGIELLVMQAKQFVVLFTVEDAHQQVGGFYTMVQQMNSEWDWQQFWMFTGFLSLALAFMNFLPIPMLDGGYIMFILWEMVTGKKVSDKVIYYANNVGLFIVLGLMIYANTDWLRN